MEIDPGTSSKKPRLPEMEEIVEIEDDEDRSTNQEITAFVEQEGAQDGSKSASSAEKTISNPPVAEGSQVSAMIVQKYISSEEETSKVPSQEELVKDFTEKRSQVVDENISLCSKLEELCPLRALYWLLGRQREMCLELPPQMWQVFPK